MSAAHLSAILSASAGVIILLASFFQWWNVQYDGKLQLRFWTKVMFVILIAMELAGLGLALAS